MHCTIMNLKVVTIYHRVVHEMLYGSLQFVESPDGTRLERICFEPIFAVDQKLYCILFDWW